MHIKENIEGVEVLADPMLEKVFHNLMDNSIRHGKATVVKINLKNDDDVLTIEFEDNGKGLTDIERQRILAGNTGHGLDLVKGILGITGISLSEEGRQGDGAKFLMNIPVGCYRDICTTSK